MQTYTQILYQVVFATKYRRPTLTHEVRPKVFATMASMLQNRRCRSYAVNGVEDHVHLVFSLHPSVSLSDLIRDIKVTTNDLIKSCPDEAPDFTRWQRGYSAFTYTFDRLPTLVRYVARQEERHQAMSTKEELRIMLERHGVEYDERYFD